MSDLGTAAFDHAAKLQTRLDRLELELGLVTLAVLALAVGSMILAWRLWQQ